MKILLAILGVIAVAVVIYIVLMGWAAAHSTHVEKRRAEERRRRALEAERTCDPRESDWLRPFPRPGISPVKMNGKE